MLNYEVTLSLSAAFVEGSLSFYLCLEASDPGIASLGKVAFKFLIF